MPAAAPCRKSSRALTTLPERLSDGLRGFALGVLLLGAWAAHAAQFRGVVSHVTDGDSIWVRPAAGGEAIEIRLLRIDAPEGCQTFGPQAKAALARRILREPVLVRTEGHDDYGRTLARIQHKGEDVNAWMVREGYAWAFGNRKGPDSYAALEAEARAARRGLWSLPGVQSPRDFRRLHGRCERR